MNDLYREWGVLVGSLTSGDAAVDRKIRDVDGLKQLLDVVTSTPCNQTNDPAERLKLVVAALDAVQSVLNTTEPYVDGTDASAEVGVLRSSCLQLLFKLQRASAAFPVNNDFRTSSERVFACCHQTLLVDNEGNASVCCKLIGMILRHRVQLRERERQKSQDPTLQPDPTLPGLMQKVLTTFNEWLEQVPAVCEARLSASDTSSSGAGLAGNRSFRGVAELVGTVKDTMLGFMKAPALVESTKGTWTSTLTALSVDVPLDAVDANSPAVSEWSHLQVQATALALVNCGAHVSYNVCVAGPVTTPLALVCTRALIPSDACRLQARLLVWVHTLISFSQAHPQLFDITWGTPELVRTLCRLLTSSPVSTPAHRDVLTNVRMIFSKILRAPEPPPAAAAEIYRQVPQLLTESPFLTRETVYANRAHAFSIALDLVLQSKEHLTSAQLQSLAWTFLLELLRDDAMATLGTQIKCAETVMKVLEHFCQKRARRHRQEGGEVQSQPPAGEDASTGARIPRHVILGWLMLLLQKLESCADVVRSTIQMLTRRTVLCRRRKKREPRRASGCSRTAGRQAAAGLQYWCCLVDLCDTGRGEAASRCLASKHYMARLTVAQGQAVTGDESDGASGTAVTIGTRNDLVETLDTTQSSVAGPLDSGSGAGSKAAEGLHVLMSRLMQSSHGVLRLLEDVATASGDSRTFQYEELRQFSHTLACTLPVLHCTSALPAMQSSSSLYEQYAVVLNCLSYLDFEDVMAEQLAKMMEVVAEDGHVIAIANLLFKTNIEVSNATAAKMKNSAVAKAVLRHVIDCELDCLEDLTSKRAGKVLELVEVVMRRLTEAVAAHHEGRPQNAMLAITHLFPLIVELASVVLDRLQGKRTFDGYLSILRSICKLTLGKPDALFKPLSETLTAHGVIERLLRLMVDILHGPNCKPGLRERIVEILLMLPCRIEEKIKMDAIVPLMEPLLIALQSEKADLVSLAVDVLCHWVDVMKPNFLESRLEIVSHSMMPLLWDLMLKPPYAKRVMSILGKLGGRNSTHMAGPQSIENRANNEHGLRLILTFEPSTSFLVPLDRVIQLLTDGQQGLNPRVPVHFRREAFRFLMYCLACMLNLDLRLAETSATPAQNREHLASVLLTARHEADDGGGSTATPVTNSKTRLQHKAENGLLRELLIAVLAAGTDRELRDVAEPFNKGVWRHIALLFASGLAKSSAEMGVTGPWAAPASQSMGQSKSNLGQLNLHVVLDALVAVLTREKEQCIAAAATAINMFVSTLLDVTAAQKAYDAVHPPPPRAPVAAVKTEATRSEEANGGARDGAPDGVAASAPAAAKADPAAAHSTSRPASGHGGSAGKGRDSMPSALQESPASIAGLPRVLDDLVYKVLHACHGELWRSKIGGAAGVGVLLRRLPPAFVKPWAPRMLAGIMASLKKVPAHSTSEVATLNGLARSLLQRTLAACGTLARADGSAAMEVDSERGAAPAASIDLEGDPHLASLVDEIVTVLFAHTSSMLMRQAALELLHSLAAETGRSPGDVIGARREWPILNLRSRALHSSVMGALKSAAFMLGKDERVKKPASHRVVLVRRTIATAQALQCFVSIKPPLFTDATIFHQAVQEASMVLHTKDEQLQRLMISVREGERGSNQCLQVQLVCAELLGALLEEPAWRDSEAAWPDVRMAIEVMVPLMCSGKAALARRCHATLAAVIPALLATPERAVCLEKPVTQVMTWIGAVRPDSAPPPDAPPHANRPEITARLNSVPFLDNLLRIFAVLPEQLPRPVGTVLMRHLLDWLDPAAMHAPRPSPAAADGAAAPAAPPMLPLRWSRGDHLLVVSRVYELLSLLPDWSAALLEPSAGGGGVHAPCTIAHPGLLTLTLQLEAALHAWTAKSLGGTSNHAALQLWTLQRKPLAALLLRHSAWGAIMAHTPERPFDVAHFGLMHSIVLHEDGAALLAALVSDSECWHSAFAAVIARPVPGHDDAAQVHTVSVVQLAASVLARQPDWLAQNPALLPFVPQLWGSASHIGILPDLAQRSTAERLLTQNLMRLMLAYLDAVPDELPRFFDLFQLFDHPAYITKVPLVDYVAERIPHVDASHRAALLTRAFSDALLERSPAAAGQILSSVVLPMLTAAQRRGELDALVTDAALAALVAFLDRLQGQVPSSDASKGDGDGSPRLKAFAESSVCMVELLRAVAIPLGELSKARWAPHVKLLAQALWRFLGRYKEPVLDHALLNAALLLCRHVDVSHRSPSGGRKAMQLYVNLLRAGGPEHDTDVVRRAMDLIVPLLAQSCGAEERGGPLWVSHMRKSLADASDLLASTGIQQATSTMTHALGTTVRHADLFYPYMHHLASQFITCTSKVAIQPTGSQPYQITQACDLWPVVLDTILCMAYWLRCLLAGQTLVHGTSDASAGAGEASSAVRVGSRRGREGGGAGDEGAGAPRRRVSEASGDVSRGIVTAAGRERLAPVVPGSSEAEQRITSAKMSRAMLESLFMLPMRMALQTDRHGPRGKAAHPPTRMSESPHCAKIWARAMHVVKSLHEVLPSTSVRLASIISRTSKETVGPGGSEDSARRLSVLATIVHVVRFTFRSPGVLADGFKYLRDADRLDAVFSSTDMVDDLCPLMLELTSEAARLQQTEAECEDGARKSQLREAASAAFNMRGIVMGKVESVLGALRDEVSAALLAAVIDASPDAAPLALRPPFTAALRLLENELMADSERGSAVEAVNSLLTTLPVASHAMTAVIKSATEQAGSQKALAAMLGNVSHAGSFLQAFHRLMRMLQLPGVIHVINQMEPAAKAWSKFCMGTIMILSMLAVAPASALPKDVSAEVAPIVSDMFAVISIAISHQSRLQAQEALQIIKKLADIMRRAEVSTGSRCFWAPHFEQLVYDVCISKDGAFLDRLPEAAFKTFECEHVMGLSSADSKLRQAFLELYDSRIPRTIPERLEFLIKSQTWKYWSHTFWLKRALDLLLCMLKKEQAIALAPNSAQVVSLLGLDASKAAVMSNLTVRSGSIGLVKLPSMSAGGAVGASTDGLPPLDSIEDLQNALNNGSGTPDTAVLPQLAGGIQTMISDHVAFLTDMSRITVNDLVSSLTECTEHDDRISYHLWVLVFPVVWQSLQKDRQLAMAKPIISLISRFSEQVVKEGSPERGGYLKTRRAVKVVQALMESVTLSQPQPKFPPELIKFLAKNHAAWHIAIPLLETHVIIFPEETRCFHALAELYRLVKEDDLLYGLWKTMIVSSASRAQQSHAIAQRQDAGQDQRLANALTLLQLGRWQEGAESLHSLNRFYQKQYEHAYRSTPTRIPPDHIHGKGQLVLEEWISCMKQLNRWEDLYEVAKGCKNPQLTVDCEWRLAHWGKLGASLQSSHLQDTADNCIARAYQILSTTPDHKGLEDQISRIGARCQAEWSLLPPLCVQPRVDVLQKLVLMVEIGESQRLMSEVKERSVNGQAALDVPYHALDETLSTWRLRTPNAHDSLLHWATLIRWRAHVCDFVIHSFDHAQSRSPSLYSLGYRDKSWSVNMLARAARKHNLPMLTNHVINTMYGYPTMEVSEAYAKIREQCRAYTCAPEQQAMGLQLIDNTNLSYFRDEHKAGLFTLKGVLFEAMDKGEEAQQLFYAAIHIKDSSHAPWQRWGEVCANMFDRTNADVQKATSSRGASGGEGLSKEMLEQLKAKRLQYADQAFAAFFKALAFKASIAHSLVPRLLCMLAHDSYEAPHPLRQTLCSALLANTLPPHCLLPHISFLVEGLMRGERDVMRSLLFYLYQHHPQALYLPVRNTAYLYKDLLTRIQRTQAELVKAGRLPSGAQGPPSAGPGTGPDGASEAASATGPASTMAPKKEAGAEGAVPAGRAKIDLDAWPEMFAYEGLKELTELLRQNHRVLLSNVETFILEVGNQCMAKPEERLLSVVYSLLTRAYKIPLPQDALVPEQLKKELSTVSAVCYSNEMYLSWRRRGNSSFMPETFRKDIEPHQCKTLQDLMQSLKRWMVTLQGIINSKYPAVNYLEQDFPRLATHDFVDLELPGNAALLEYNPSAPIYVERVASDVHVTRRHCTSLHRLELICSNGQSRYFTMYGQQHAMSTATSFTDCRMMSVYRQVNKLLSNFPEARRRQVQLHAPILLPIWPFGYLIEEDTCNDTLGNTFETTSARYGRPPDKAILLFKDAVFRQPMPEDPRQDLQRRREAFLEICSKTFMTEQIFSQHMFKSLPSPNHIFAFKKQFCAQLAAVSLFSWLFSVPPRAPFKVVFSKGSGKIVLQDMVPHYNSNALIGAANVVLKKQELPYRFTRNLQTFVTPFGTEGWFLITQVLAAQAMRKRHSNIQWVISNFFREDVMLQHRRLVIARWQGQQISPDTSVRVVSALAASATNELLARIKDISGETLNKDELGEIKVARRLKNQAIDANHLCRMDAFWQPWL